MSFIIRRIEGKTIEVTFPQPIDAESSFGKQLATFAETPDVHLIRQGKTITGVQSPEKAYLTFLQASGASKETIQGARAALDDSKKARRERMRG